MEHIKQERYCLIDSIRGISLVNMVIFHLLYDIFVIYEQNSRWYDNNIVSLWQQGICWTFIFLSGVSWNFSKNNLKRGILISVWGGIITFATAFFISSQAVWFGILSFIGCAVLIMIPLERIIKKIDPYIGILISLFCFFFSKNIENHYLGFGEIQIIQLPQWLYHIKVFTIFGMPFSGFQSSDYFPIIPWFFLFCTGYFTWKVFKNYKKIRELFKRKIPIFYLIGKKSLWIYILHQPVCILLVHIIYSFK